MLSPVVSRHLRTYRDSIRRASVPGGRCRPALRFFPASSDAAAGEGAYCWSSSASSASSPALDESARCSPVSLSFSSDGDLCFSGCPDGLDGAEELRAIALRMAHDGYMKGLVRAFGATGGSSSAHCGGLGSGPVELLLGSWFSELDVEWVLHAREGDKLRPHKEDGCASLLDLMESWIKALKTMVQVLCITQLELRTKWPAAAGGVRKAVRYFLLLATGKAAEREQEAAQLVWFAEASVLRMLDFVDAVADAALNDDQAAAEMLPGMLQVYTCIVDDSPAVLALFKEALGTASMFDDMNGVFLRKRSKLSDAVWSMVEKVRPSFMADDCWRVSPPAEAGGVHETTRLMMNYVMLLWRNEGALNLVLQDQQQRFRMFLSEHDDYCSSSSSVADLIKNMISSSEKQLEKASNFISDPGLRYIFLMNNCSFISEKVSSLLLPLFEDYKIKRSRGSREGERLPPMEDCVSQPNQSIQAKIERDSKPGWPYQDP